MERLDKCLSDVNAVMEVEAQHNRNRQKNDDHCSGNSHEATWKHRGESVLSAAHNGNPEIGFQSTGGKILLRHFNLAEGDYPASQYGDEDDSHVDSELVGYNLWGCNASKIYRTLALG